MFITCKSCGDVFLLDKVRLKEAKVNEYLTSRCRCCAEELHTGRIPKLGSAGQFTTGGGRRVIYETKTH